MSHEKWSDLPVTSNFVINLFLDTNILVYLIDNTYPSLTEFMIIAKESKFIRLVSSKFVLLEFYAVRKKEHYLRHAMKTISKSNHSATYCIEKCSLNKKFDIPDVDFDSIKQTIEQEVDIEKNKILYDYGILYDYCSFHNGQIDLTYKLLFKSRISKEDCLVLASAIIPEPVQNDDAMHLLTRDKQFKDEYNHRDITGLIIAERLKVPYVYRITELPTTSGNISLTNQVIKPNMEAHFKDFVKCILKSQLGDLYLGATIEPHEKKGPLPPGVLLMEFELGKKVPENVYLVIISGDLKFIYNVRHEIKQFWYHNKPYEEGTILSKRDSNLSFQVFDKDDQGNKVNVSETIVNALRAKGNLVFISPDTSIND